MAGQGTRSCDGRAHPEDVRGERHADANMPAPSKTLITTINDTVFKFRRRLTDQRFTRTNRNALKYSLHGRCPRVLRSSDKAKYHYPIPRTVRPYSWDRKVGRLALAVMCAATPMFNALVVSTCGPAVMARQDGFEHRLATRFCKTCFVWLLNSFLKFVGLSATTITGVGVSFPRNQR